MSETRSPVVIFAIDSADSELVLQWMDEGHLPTLRSLVDRGFIARIDEPELVNEIGSWTSLFSGVSKVRHGYYSLRQLVPGTYTINMTTPKDARGASPFWCHTQGHGSKCFLVDPPECNVYDGVAGIQIANWGTHKSERLAEPFMCRPAEWTDEFIASFGEAPRLTTFEPDTDENLDRRQWETALARVRTKGKMGRSLLAREEFDLVVFSFHEMHTVGHRLWTYRESCGPENPMKHALRDLFIAIDEEIGTLVAAVGDDANVFVVSPYGLNGLYPMSGLTEAFMHGLGYQAKCPPRNVFASLDWLTAARRLIPAGVRRRVADRLSPQSQEALIAHSFRNDTQWSESRAFSIPSLYNALIRINLKGREPEGIVAADEYHTVLDELVSDLRLLVDPKAGLPAVGKIVRTCEAFGCGTDHPLPDLVVEWNQSDRFIDTLVHPRVTIRQTKQTYHRPSFHTSQGFLAARGPAISPAAGRGARRVSVLDMAPTFLALLGIDLPSCMQGRVMPECGGALAGARLPATSARMAILGT